MLLSGSPIEHSITNSIAPPSLSFRSTVMSLYSDISSLSPDISSPQDTLISTLESNLERYKVLGSLTAEEGTKVQVLEQSLSSHERALESLKAEHQRKQNELREAEEEVKKLRTAVAKKVQTHQYRS